jgi:TetR/AcrR family transcriptional regulator, transcriptional repressor of bet genes
MGRPTNRTERRRELARAYERTLARHGLGGATVAAIADEAGVAPGLIHHHFADRTDLVVELVSSLIGRFRSRLPEKSDPAERLTAYVDAALALQPLAGRTAAKAWVGLFAEAIGSRRVAEALQRVLLRELSALEANLRAVGLSAKEAQQGAAGILSCILGCLIFGALLPGRATGFAAPFAKRVLRELMRP